MAECPPPSSQVCPPIPLPSRAGLLGIEVGNGPQGVRCGQQLLQMCFQLMEGGPTAAVIGPAVLHEFIERGGAVHGRGQPVPILNALHYLQQGRGGEARGGKLTWWPRASLCSRKIIAMEPLNLPDQEIEVQKHRGQGGEMRVCGGESHGGPGRRRRVRSTRAHLLIAHLPIGLVPKAQHLPHHNPEAPHVTGCGEDPMRDGFRGCPTDGDLSSLIGRMGQKGDVFQGTEEG